MMKLKFIFAALFVLAALTTATMAQTKTAKGKTQSYVVAVCRDANAVEILDGDSLQSLARVTVGEAPHEAVGSADGRLVYIANYGTKERAGNSLSVIELATRKEIKRIDLGDLKRPHGLQEVGGKIYFTAEASKMVARYDPATDKVDWTAKTDQIASHMLAVGDGGKRIYTANLVSGSVTAIETRNGESIVTQIAVGKEPEGIALSPDGKTLWVGHRAGGLITIIDTATNTTKETLTAGQMPLRISFTPDGKQAWAINPQEGALMVFDAATRKEIGRVAINGAPGAIVFSPDGKRAYTTDFYNDKVLAIDTEKFKTIGERAVETLADGISFISSGK